MNELIPYLDKRLDRLEEKVEVVRNDVSWMKNKYWMIFGMASVVSTIASIILMIMFGK